MRGHAALLIVLLLAGTGCGRRERANPFDVHNPTTGGQPAGFQALAGNARVALRWDRVSAPGVLGYQVYRRSGSEATFTALSDVLPLGRTEYLDPGLANGLEHHYQLYYVLLDGSSEAPAQDSAIPGPMVPWATDRTAPALLTLTADGRRVALVDGDFEGPTQVAVDLSNGRVWTSDTEGGRIVVFDPATLTRTVIPGFDSPAAIAIDPVGHTAWICDEGRNLVYRIDRTGAPVPPTLLQFNLPLSVAVDYNDGSIWVCENGGGTVQHRDSNGIRIGGAAVTRPSRVAVDRTTGEAWVTSFDRREVYRFTHGGTIASTWTGFAGPIGIAVDGTNDRVWIADAAAGALIAYRRDGTEVLRVRGLSQVREVAVDPVTGAAWATVTGAGQIVSVALDGTVLSRITRLSQPYAIALDPFGHFVPIP